MPPRWKRIRNLTAAIGLAAGILGSAYLFSPLPMPKKMAVWVAHQKVQLHQWKWMFARDWKHLLPSEKRSAFSEMAHNRARKYGLNAGRFAVQVKAESGLDENARSSKNAIGLAQVQIGAAKDVARRRGQYIEDDKAERLLKDPFHNLDIAAQRMGELKVLARKRLEAFARKYKSPENAIPLRNPSISNAVVQQYAEAMYNTGHEQLNLPESEALFRNLLRENAAKVEGRNSPQWIMLSGSAKLSPNLKACQAYLKKIERNLQAD
ncbi:MAG: transglycosylase SLT domain-containing protein [Candidatus Diapherotrites archaeon]